MEIKEIDNRYSELAESDCCLSCGGAINYAVPMPGEVCVDLGSGRGTDALRMADRVGSTGFVSALISQKECWKRRGKMPKNLKW